MHGLPSSLPPGDSTTDLPASTDWQLRNERSRGFIVYWLVVSPPMKSRILNSPLQIIVNNGSEERSQHHYSANINRPERVYYWPPLWETLDFRRGTSAMFCGGLRNFWGFLNIGNPKKGWFITINIYKWLILDIQSLVISPYCIKYSITFNITIWACAKIG